MKLGVKCPILSRSLVGKQHSARGGFLFTRKSDSFPLHSLLAMLTQVGCPSSDPPMNTMPSQFLLSCNLEGKEGCFVHPLIHPSIHFYIIREITQVSKQAAPSRGDPSWRVLPDYSSIYLEILHILLSHCLPRPSRMTYDCERVNASSHLTHPYAWDGRMDHMHMLSSMHVHR